MSIRVLKITDDGKLARERGDFVWLTGADAVVQLLKQRLRVFKGECFMDITLGPDYFDVIFPKTSSDFRRYLELKRVIEGTPGVIELISLEIKPINKERRHYEFEFKVKSDYGQLEVEV